MRTLWIALALVMASAALAAPSLAAPAPVKSRIRISRAEANATRVQFVPEAGVREAGVREAGVREAGVREASLKGELRRHWRFPDGRRLFDSETSYGFGSGAGMVTVHHLEVYSSEGTYLCGSDMSESNGAKVSFEAGTHVVWREYEDRTSEAFDPLLCERRITEGTGDTFVAPAFAQPRHRTANFAIDVSSMHN